MIYKNNVINEKIGIIIKDDQNFDISTGNIDIESNTSIK